MLLGVCSQLQSFPEIEGLIFDKTTAKVAVDGVDDRTGKLNFSLEIGVSLSSDKVYFIGDTQVVEYFHISRVKYEFNNTSWVSATIEDRLRNIASWVHGKVRLTVTSHAAGHATGKLSIEGIPSDFRVQSLWSDSFSVKQLSPQGERTCHEASLF